MQNNTRSTITFKTSLGAEIVHYTYITKFEEREITEIYLKSMDEKNAGIPSTNRAKFQADDKAFQIVIVSLNGETDKQKILDGILQMPTVEYNEISEVVGAIVEPKKKVDEYGSYFSSDILKGDFLVLAICEKYGWTWQEFMSTPKHIIDVAVEKYKIDALKLKSMENSPQ